MYISKVTIRNYRNFLNSKFEFKKGINTIIGENGAGKTNLFNAMRLLLDDSFYKFSHRLEESDFNRALGDWKGHWIIISLEFSELSYDEAIQALFVHGLGEIVADKVDKATYNLFFRPKPEIRKRLSVLPTGDNAALNKLLSEITIADYETVFTGKSTIDFNDEDKYKELVGDFEKVKFAYYIDQSLYGTRIPNQLSVSNEISFTFIKALRDVVSDFHNNRTNPLLNLLKERSKNIADIDFVSIATQVDQLNCAIEGLPDVVDITKDIKETIKQAVGETYAPSSLSIKSSLSNEADKLLKSLRLYIGEPGEEYEGGIADLSLGGANLIYLTLKLLEYKYQIENISLANFLFIEEPEAHIHTHIQKTLFDNIDFDNTQIIYSTHSPHISEVNKISQMNILAKYKNYVEVYQPSSNLEPADVVKLERYLDAVRSCLLFAKAVILVEGDAEEILIPILIKEVFGLSLDEMGISLINIRGVGFENVAQLFSDDRIRRKCSIITDLDTALVKPPVGKYNKAERLGLARKTKLDELYKSNDWVSAFYALHTFEVDFITNGNVEIVKNLVSEVYVDQPTIIKSNSELSSTSVSVYGKRVLIMAANAGKGWFAIMLGNHITSDTIIPDYILSALCRLIPSENLNLIADIVQYRISLVETRENSNEFEPLHKAINSFKGKTIDKGSLIKTLKTEMAKDIIIKFLEEI